MLTPNWVGGRGTIMSPYHTPGTNIREIDSIDCDIEPVNDFHSALGNPVHTIQVDVRTRCIYNDTLAIHFTLILFFLMGVVLCLVHWTEFA